MDDLEILCRPCHEAHHRIERALRKPKGHKSKGISRQALARYLTPTQKSILQRRFIFSSGELYSAILDGVPAVVSAALEMSGKKYAYAPKSINKATKGWNSARHHARLMR